MIWGEGLFINFNAIGVLYLKSIELHGFRNNLVNVHFKHGELAVFKMNQIGYFFKNEDDRTRLSLGIGMPLTGERLSYLEIISFPFYYWLEPINKPTFIPENQAN